MEGILRCTRYSFGPNRLHYCGPDANAELRSYIESNHSDPGLANLLKQFQTLYPYLRHIATANHIADPFDPRVVEAYWLGNELLETVEKQAIHRFMIDDLKIKKKMGNREFEWLESKIGQGAVPHHSFHVLNVWRREGSERVPHTLENMDECRVSWGTVTAVNGPELTVTTEPLLYIQGKFALGPAAPKTITRRLESEYDIEQITVGQLVSIHWSVPCEVITKEQAARLKKYTMKNIEFANQTV